MPSAREIRAARLAPLAAFGSAVLVGISLVGAYWILDADYVHERQELTLRGTDGAMAFALARLERLGPISDDGEQLRAGSTVLSGSTVVDEVVEATGYGCTIFRGARRAATVARRDGVRALGTSANTEVTRRVFTDGGIFRGVTRTLDRDWVILYVPLYSGDGTRVGMVATYLDHTVFLRGIRTFRATLGATLAAAYLLVVALLIALYRQGRRRLAAAHVGGRRRAQFFAMMSHELRTPLVAAMNTGAVLRGHADPEVSEAGTTVEEESRELLSVINNILDASKLEADRMELTIESLDLKRVVARAVRRAGRLSVGGAVTLRVELAETLPKARGDAVKLGQVLNNLLSNALKFTHQGEVVVSAFAGPAGFVDIEVSDSGIGIPEDRLAAIWQPFQQAGRSTDRVYGGTGLGLAIVKGLVERMSGSVTVRSETGEGSVFCVRLPVAS